MKIGIVQGRLSPPLNGFQECPVDWEREFRLLSDLKLDHIEWIVTKQSFETNPIFSEDLFFYNISSICADNLIDKRIIDTAFLFNNLQPICENAIKNRVDTITIPLLEESDVSDVTTRNAFISNINRFALTYYPEILFSFEIESYEEAISDVINSNDNFRLTYDTGNMTSLGISHEYYLDKFISKIDTVHLKDRNFDGMTVSPGKGKTDFDFILNYLSMKKDINYTIQTDRGESEKEVETIISHIKFFKSFTD